jgi:hypothetical protein
MFARGFIPTTQDGELPSLEWMRDNPQIVNSWHTIHPKTGGAAVYYGALPTDNSTP